MSLQTHNDLISRITNGFESTEPIHLWAPATRSSPIAAGLYAGRGFFVQKRPSSLETGVTAHIPEQVIGSVSQVGSMMGYYHMILLGTLDISGASGTFTDGSNMGTSTFGGQTINRYGPVWMEVTTALNATPGNLTITYVDQDGNTAETTSALNLSASAVVGSGSLMRLNSTDIGVRDITNATRGAGTTPTGIIKFWGLIPIGAAISDSTHGGFVINLFNKRPLYRLPADAETGGLTFITTNGQGVEGSVRFVGDN